MKFISVTILLTIIGFIFSLEKQMATAQDIIKNSKKDNEIVRMVSNEIEKKEQLEKQTLVHPIGSHQIVLSRMLMNSIPTSELDSIVQSVSKAGQQQGRGPVSILPPRIVNQSTADRYERNPDLALEVRKRKQINRTLKSTPYQFSGNGNQNIGPHGFSPLSFPMMNTEGATVSPYVPKNGPPSPTRIQLEDSMQDNLKIAIYTSSEYRAKQLEAKHLEKYLIAQLGFLKDEETDSKTILKEGFQRMIAQATKFEKQKELVNRENRQIKKQLDIKNNRIPKNVQFPDVYTLLKNIPNLERRLTALDQITANNNQLNSPKKLTLDNKSAKNENMSGIEISNHRILSNSLLKNMQLSVLKKNENNEFNKMTNKLMEIDKTKRVQNNKSINFKTNGEILQNNSNLNDLDYSFIL